MCSFKQMTTHSSMPFNKHTHVQMSLQTHSPTQISDVPRPYRYICPAFNRPSYSRSALCAFSLSPSHCLPPFRKANCEKLTRLQKLISLADLINWWPNFYFNAKNSIINLRSDTAALPTHCCTEANRKAALLTHCTCIYKYIYMYTYNQTNLKFKCTYCGIY